MADLRIASPNHFLKCLQRGKHLFLVHKKGLPNCILLGALGCGLASGHCFAQTAGEGRGRLQLMEPVPHVIAQPTDREVGVCDEPCQVLAQGQAQGAPVLPLVAGLSQQVAYEGRADCGQERSDPVADVEASNHWQSLWQLFIAITGGVTGALLYWTLVGLASSLRRAIRKAIVNRRSKR